jgi:aspartate aminotransferase/aminotransferase
MESRGRSVIHFESGRPDFDTPVHIKEAANQALREGKVHYAPSAGDMGLREAISECLLKYKGVKYDPVSEIMVSAGGQEAIYITIQALIDPGDEVLVPDPGYGPFRSSIKLAGGVTVPLPFRSENSIALDLKEAEGRLTDRTKAIILNSPNNPTGGVLPADEVEKLCRFMKEKGLLIFSDEAYDRILYEGNDFLSPASVPGMKDRTIVLGTLSKTYSMTGWRVGYVAAPAEVLAGAIKVHQNAVLSICSFAQAGAIAALRGPQDCVDKMVASYGQRRKVILESIEKTPGLNCPIPPLGAFYVFAKHNVRGMSSEALSDHLLEKGGVATVPGSGFGDRGEGYLRISYARALEDCREGMARINRVMGELMNSIS